LGAGHNYALEAYFTGPLNPRTGMIVNVRDIDQMLKAVVAPLDHRNLSAEIPAFSETAATAENLAVYLYNAITKQLSASGSQATKAPLENLTLQKVRLFESSDLWVDCE
jgi:6-pyruvoyltetrahydropterin/6-carboxytetrahydropterin synthase